MSFNLSIDQAVSTQVGNTNPTMPASAPGGRSGAGSAPAYGKDPYTGSGHLNFTWDRKGQGWDAGYWYGSTELLKDPMMGTLAQARGAGVPAFTRASTSSRVSQTGSTDTVEVDAAAFDWIAGPSGRNRYALRADQADGLLSFQSLGNIRRREGAISLWIRPQWAGSSVPVTNQIFWQSANWQLGRISGSKNILWFVQELGGTYKSVSFDPTAWAANTWHHLVASWSRPYGTIKLYVDGALAGTTVISQRLTELDDSQWLGFGKTLGEVSNSYIGDFRTWGRPATDRLASFLFAVKA